MGVNASALRSGRRHVRQLLSRLRQDDRLRMLSRRRPPASNSEKFTPAASHAAGVNVCRETGCGG